MTISALPPLTADEAHRLPEGQDRGNVVKAAIPAEPSRAAFSPISFLTSASDGIVSGRLPTGWDQEGVCWTPYCCGPVQSFTIDCPVGGEALPTFPPPLSPNPSDLRTDVAKPFVIETELACLGGSDEKLERLVSENLRKFTPERVAAQAHSQMRAAAVDVSGDAAVCFAKAAGVLYENRKMAGSLWIPDVAVPFAVREQIIRIAGGRVADIFDTRSFIGPGLPNVGPDGQPAPAGQAWIYITAPHIDYGLTDIEVHTDSPPLQNMTRVFADRKAIVRIDSCGVFAARISLDCAGNDQRSTP